jgi:hypothetical protein
MEVRQGEKAAGRRRSIGIPLTVLLFGCGGVAIGAGVASLEIHHAETAPVSLLGPASHPGTTPDPSAQRAIALVVGETRPVDGLTFDQWYRIRLARLAPGISVRYVAQLLGNGHCGQWEVFAIAAKSSPTTARGVIDEYGAIASVDVVSGDIVGLGSPAPARGHVTQGAGSSSCPVQPRASGASWLDEFHQGATP